MWSYQKRKESFTDFIVEEKEHEVQLKAIGFLAGVSRVWAVKYEITYTVKGGKLKIKTTAKVSDKVIWLPRFGFELKMENAFKFLD